MKTFQIVGDKIQNLSDWTHFKLIKDNKRVNKTVNSSINQCRRNVEYQKKKKEFYDYLKGRFCE